MKFLAATLLMVPALSFSAGLAGLSNYYLDTQAAKLQQAEINALNAYSACMRAGGQCGAPPQIQQTQQPAEPNRPQQCHRTCTWSAGTEYCNTYCF